MVKGINKNYTHLFNQETEEDGEKGEEQQDQDGIDGSVDTFGKNWGYVAMIDRVSETQRTSWREVMGMSVFEFFNTLCYARDKAEEDKKRLELWKRQH